PPTEFLATRSRDPTNTWCSESTPSSVHCHPSAPSSSPTDPGRCRTGTSRTGSHARCPSGGPRALQPRAVSRLVRSRLAPAWYLIDFLSTRVKRRASTTTPTSIILPDNSRSLSLVPHAQALAHELPPLGPQLRREAGVLDEHPRLDVPGLPPVGEVRRGDQRPLVVDHDALRVQARPRWSRNRSPRAVVHVRLRQTERPDGSEEPVDEGRGEGFGSSGRGRRPVDVEEERHVDAPFLHGAIQGLENLGSIEGVPANDDRPPCGLEEPLHDEARAPCDACSRLRSRPNQIQPWRRSVETLRDHHPQRSDDTGRVDPGERRHHVLGEPVEAGVDEIRLRERSLE